MKKLILILLPAAIFLAACEEPAPPPPRKPVAKHKAESGEFRAVEKPSSYAPEEQ
jgi:hypothetical protein